MAKKTSIPPSTKELAFDCPHCGAYTTQYWYKLLRVGLEKNSLPETDSESHREFLTKCTGSNEEQKVPLLEMADKIDSGLVFFRKSDSIYSSHHIGNIHLSKCYNCEEIAVWIHSNLVFPYEKVGVLPNPDLPAEIICDFEEARSILGESPRGASALLRLCIQKLCIHLGEEGKVINDDIASLVKKGLNPMIQQSLDIVRVVGNEAVHPAVIDLKDDRDTALKLLGLINSITDQMITHPKHVKDLYEKLPEEKRKAIAERDKQS